MFHWFTEAIGVFLDERVHAYRNRGPTGRIDDFTDPDFPGARGRRPRPPVCRTSAAACSSSVAAKTRSARRLELPDGALADLAHQAVRVATSSSSCAAASLPRSPGRHRDDRRGPPRRPANARRPRPEGARQHGRARGAGDRTHPTARDTRPAVLHASADRAPEGGRRATSPPRAASLDRRTSRWPPATR